jgi:hypothetical protein
MIQEVYLSSKFLLPDTVIFPAFLGKSFIAYFYIFHTAYLLCYLLLLYAQHYRWIMLSSQDSFPEVSVSLISVVCFLVIYAVVLCDVHPFTCVKGSPVLQDTAPGLLAQHITLQCNCYCSCVPWQNKLLKLVPCMSMMLHDNFITSLLTFPGLMWTQSIS